MKDFSWDLFAMTGDVQSYLLYKEISSDEFGDMYLELAMQQEVLDDYCEL